MTACNQDIMCRSHVACFAAQLAWQLGRKLTFDTVKEGLWRRGANRMRFRAPRQPWSFNL